MVLSRSARDLLLRAFRVFVVHLAVLLATAGGWYKARMDMTEGHLLDGRVRYAQPRDGFRSGIEPVLLAATVPARPGERVLEAGSGAGAAMLCLAARVAGVSGVGVERDPALAALAARNAADNGWADLRFVAADLGGLPELGRFDHAFANPPYHAAGGTSSADAARDAARRAPPALFATWAAAMGRLLRPRGTLTWIVTAAVLPACVAAMGAAGCAPSAVLPLWPAAGREAKLVLLRGVRGGRGGFRVLPGVVLHAASGGFTPAAEAVLRRGDALPM
jgi:tRNA1(Val) A37 N6-methylase TrmN6